MLLFHLKCLSLQTSTYNLGRAEWRTSKVSKPLPILFLPDDNFLIYSYILFSATFVKLAKTNRSRIYASFGSANSCIITAFNSSSVRNSRSLTFGLMWNCANGFLGISPLKCARITTPFSHMQFAQILPFCKPASVER